ncbi:MAG: helix-turn-helix transcriptional regulator [Butyricicoccus pullicaecorum]|nr:helix-turn-helix transcriptional regulator [Butyricicoccus pullicaecorum]
MKFGEKLQALRRAKGLSQEQLSEALGVTRQAVSKWELNASIPDVEKLLALSDFFQVSTDYLLKETIQMPEPVAPPAFAAAPRTQRVNVKLLVGGILTGVSSLALFIVWVLSRVYPVTYIHENRVAGYTQVWTGYGGFVEFHVLWPLTKSCWILLIAGLMLLFWKPLDRRFSLSARWQAFRERHREEAPQSKDDFE